MHEGKRGTAAVIVALAIPVAALGGLAGFATAGRTSLPSRKRRPVRVGRSSIAVPATTSRRPTSCGGGGRAGGFRPVERAEFRERVAALEAARPQRCNATGRLTR